MTTDGAILASQPARANAIYTEALFRMFGLVALELVSNVVEIASRWPSSSSGDGLLGAHRQLGQDTVLELRSIYQQAHKAASPSGFCLRSADASAHSASATP